MAKLTARQQKFVDEYLVDLNATQAAIRAGYSPKTAKSVGSENLTKPDIVAQIEAARQVLQEKTQVTQQWVIERLRENVERAMQAVDVVDKDGRRTGEYQYEGNVANQALNLLGKHLGMFTDKVDHTSGGQPIRFTLKIGDATVTEGTR